MTSPVIQANIDVHTRMAESYDRLEPHFRPENVAKVRARLEELSRRVGPGKLLDLGCGTGFILRLARDLFAELHGIDVTQAMLDRVDTSSGNIHLHQHPAENLPFADGSFDAVTAYSFLHHLEDHRAVLREARRVLRPGGVLYVDLEPNKLFWERLGELGDVPASELPPFVMQARSSVLDTDAKVERDFRIPRETFRRAEYTKAILGGLDPGTLAEECLALGFESCEVTLDWFVGQAQIMHGQSFERAAHIEEYLRAIRPLGDHLFKYLRFLATTST